MAGPIGFSFAPGAGDVRNGGANPRPQGPQEAVAIKSLRLPKTPAFHQIADQSLLTSPGGAGVADLTGFLRSLMQGRTSSAGVVPPSPSQMGGSSAPTAPPPPPVGPSPSLSAILTSLMSGSQSPSGMPTLPSGGGTDTTGGWRDHERDLGGNDSQSPRSGPSPAPVSPAPSPGGDEPYDSGTGQNPIPPQKDMPLDPSPGLPPHVSYGVAPGDQSADPQPHDGNEANDNWGTHPPPPDQGAAPQQDAPQMSESDQQQTEAPSLFDQGGGGPSQAYWDFLDRKGFNDVQGLW